jgi:ATP-dependent Clp protease ATP-binding subunit ClpC
MTTQTPPVTSLYDRFTELARRAVVAARDVAESLGHDHIGTEHLLLGLAQTAGTASEILRAHGLDLGRTRDETARVVEEHLRTLGARAGRPESAQNALAAIGIDVAEIQRRAEENFGPGALKYPRAPFSVPAKKSLQAALREARALGTEVIDTEHLLLGVLDTGGTAGRVLANLGVDRDGLRRSVLDRADAPTGANPNAATDEGAEAGTDTDVDAERPTEA